MAAFVALLASCDSAEGPATPALDVAGAESVGDATAVSAPDGASPPVDVGPPDAAPPDAGPPPLVHVDLGEHARGDLIALSVAPGFDAVLIQARGAPEGLYHTTEGLVPGPGAGFFPYDPIADTPECPPACDADGDGVLFARECGARDTGEAPCRGASDNLMFWTAGGLRELTPGQGAVARCHPAVSR